MSTLFERSSGSLGMFETHLRLFGLGTVMMLADGELTRLGSAWHVANTTIIAPYKAFSREKLPARIGTHIGLMHVNVTLTDLSITEMFTCHQAIINANNSKNDGTTRTTAVIITATLPGFQFVFTYLLYLPKSVNVTTGSTKDKLSLRGMTIAYDLESRLQQWDATY
uniref:Uncharacterized protein n=1 Tax=Glossina austeni TaxID=7395 RepID=A0A1A9UXK8_GLOAU